MTLNGIRLIVTLGVFVFAWPSFADAQDSPQAYLDQLKEMLPDNPPWNDWLDTSGELPPDFSSMPSVPLPPDPLGDGGNQVTNAEGWPARRLELLEQFHHWILGTVPPRPDNLTAEILSEQKAWGATVRDLELRFGPERAARLGVQLYIPEGDGPFPIFMTQDNHRAWAMIALRRGYLAVVYAGADSKDDTESFVDAYKDHDWSKLARRAWAASRCIDYLESVPQADTEKIVLTGHSRNGKMSLMASAMDERITAVISSSSGAGGALATRYYSEQHFGEGIELITRNFPDWFHPRWRFFVGREDKLPIDLHQLVALSAPRACLLSIAYNDGVESSWAMQQTYLSAKNVYQLHDATDRLAILWRPAGHETWPTIIEQYLDWADTQFGRGQYAFPERLIHPWDWADWRAHATTPFEPVEFTARTVEDVLRLNDGSVAANREAYETRRAEVREHVLSMLGDPPPEGRIGPTAYGAAPAHVEQVLGRQEAGALLKKEDVVFGEYINADIYMPEAFSTEGDVKHPVILWLPPASPPRGYVAAYRRGDQAFRTLARAGYAVFCYDPVGYGRRIEEVEGFYTRHPHWSLMGKMVRDAQEALDAIEALPYADPENITVVGYALGAFTALHLAAVDERPARYALVAPPQPFRADPADSPTGGIQRWSKINLLLPRLGLFEGTEAHIPYDIADCIGVMAPRPALIVRPKVDRESVETDVALAVEGAQRAYALYGADGRLALQSPDTYNHFATDMQQEVVRWLESAAPSR